MPCSERSQGLLLLTQEMHYWDFLPRSFAPPHSFIPPWSSFCQSAEARCQPHPKARAECPHPLCSSFTISPTHTFIQSPQHSQKLQHFFIYFHYFFPFSAFYIVFALQSFPQRSLLFRACNKTITCVASISTAIHLQAFLAPLPLAPSFWNSFSAPFLAVSPSHTHSAWLTGT